MKNFFWKPKTGVLYKTNKTKKMKEGYGIKRTITRVFFIDENKQSHSASYMIHNDGTCEIRYKKNKVMYPVDELKFKKYSSNNPKPYGEVHMGEVEPFDDFVWTYIVKVKKPKGE